MKNLHPRCSLFSDQALAIIQKHGFFFFFKTSLGSSLIYSALHPTNKSFTHHHVLIIYEYANNLYKSNLKGIK